MTFEWPPYVFKMTKLVDFKYKLKVLNKVLENTPFKYVHELYDSGGVPRVEAREVFRAYTRLVVDETMKLYEFYNLDKNEYTYVIPISASRFSEYWSLKLDFQEQFIDLQTGKVVGTVSSKLLDDYAQIHKTRYKKLFKWIKSPEFARCKRKLKGIARVMIVMHRYREAFYAPEKGAFESSAKRRFEELANHVETTKKQKRILVKN